MNTVRSVGYGWVGLVVAGGGAYFFAKRSINADKAEKHRLGNERRAMNAKYAELEHAGRAPPSAKGNGKSFDPASSPSQEASNDPAPTTHSSPSLALKEEDQSKYGAKEVWRSKKGDRFS